MVESQLDRSEGKLARFRSVWHPLTEGCLAGCGCLTVGGLVLAGVGVAFAASVTFRVWTDDTNLIFSGAVGRTDRIPAARPDYANQPQKDSDILNQSQELRFWLFDGVEKLRIGEEPLAPLFNISANLTPRE